LIDSLLLNRAVSWHGLSTTSTSKTGTVSPMNGGSVMRLSVVIVAAIISCGALAACFHHRAQVVEYAPPPLSTAPYK
jgi:hypothetical protein